MGLQVTTRVVLFHFPYWTIRKSPTATMKAAPKFLSAKSVEEPQQWVNSTVWRTAASPFGLSGLKKK